jgi:hypothetical protein
MSRDVCNVWLVPCERSFFIFFIVYQDLHDTSSYRVFKNLCKFAIRLYVQYVSLKQQPSVAAASINNAEHDCSISS